MNTITTVGIDLAKSTFSLHGVDAHGKTALCKIDCHIRMIIALIQLMIARILTGAAPMTIRILRLGTPRHPDEGPRLGTVRRPPRGVPKTEFATGNWYDVWYPNLAPSPETMKLGQTAETPAQWQAFSKQYRREMQTPENRHTLAMLATLSRTANFSVGCYCEDENHCHRSILRELLLEAGAEVA